MLGRIVGEHPANLAAKIGQRLDIAVLLVFPYLLYRFTTAFRPPSSRLERALVLMTTVLVLWTFALPHFPERGEPRSAAFDAYLIAFLVHWTVLSVVAATRLWRAGSGQPSVARKRMRFLSLAAAALTLALVLAAATTDKSSPLAVASGMLAFVSGVAFFLGLAPPRVVKIAWRLPEADRVQAAISDLMTLATSQEEIAHRVLGPMADIVGARAVAIRNAEGRVIGAHNVPDDVLAALEAGDGRAPLDGQEVVELQIPSGTLLVWTTPYAPFFGQEELGLLHTLGALTGLALDRVRLFAQEHQTRLALEQADQLKTNFVALAAHELRTPVTTIHGFVQTLNRRGEALGEKQRVELREALEQQTTRMASLVEQLLDLSRLDAQAVAIAPETIRVRDRLEEIVRIAAGPDADAVHVDVPEELEATVDPAAFERIVSNLVTNAFRYGRPPVIVRATQTDRHFRVTVEDRGSGVEPVFVPDLFERFTRSKGSRTVAAGTGLGLAIARSYARAHHGDLLYEDAAPQGARFQLVLPADPDVEASGGGRIRTSVG